MSSPMNSEAPYNYAHHSSYQHQLVLHSDNSSETNEFLRRKRMESAMPIICEELSQNLDAKQLLTTSAMFNMADLGCSIGPNTFHVVDFVTEAVMQKLQSEYLNPADLETQVFFVDQLTNDFNALLKSLPPGRRYYAAGVPGSFYGRLFPKASMHFVNSSQGLQWLSRVPKEVGEEGSKTWNKGRIVCGTEEVEAAYLAQYMKDMESFLEARAEELVEGGLMPLMFPSVGNGVRNSEGMPIKTFQLLGSVLMDMAKKGIVKEAKIDSFNLPLLCASLENLEKAVQKNGRFTIVRTEQLVETTPSQGRPAIRMAASSVRSAAEKPLSECFGKEIMDELFDLFVQKLMEVTTNIKDTSSQEHITLLVILKRKSERSST